MNSLFAASALDLEELPTPKMTPNVQDWLIVAGAALLVAIAAAALIYWYKKRRHHRHHHHHHHHSHSDAPETVSAEPSPTEEGHSHPRERGQRRRRRWGRRNPTLAETGGLPPVRKDDATGTPHPY